MRALFFCLLSFCLLILSARTISAQDVDDKLFESYTQYIPSVSALGLGVVGVECKHNFSGRAIELCVAMGSEVLIVHGLKNLVHELRPDCSNNKSFPSGHTATAFVGAEMVRREYGATWGMAAYSVATLSGLARVWHERHHAWDVAAGAFFGVLSADIGFWALNGVERVTGWDFSSKQSLKLSLAPSYDPLSGAGGVSFCLNF